MTLSERQAIEPFVECTCLPNTCTADHLYRFGYRIVGSDNVVAAVEIPSRILEEAVLSKLTLSCRLTPDGDVIPQSMFEHGKAPSAGSSPLSLDQLIRATFTPKNLYMEEATIANLTTMLQRLEESASVVRDALAHSRAQLVQGSN